MRSWKLNSIKFLGQRQLVPCNRWSTMHQPWYPVPLFPCNGWRYSAFCQNLIDAV